MFYSKILPNSGRTTSQEQGAIDFLKRVVSGEHPAVDSYDFMMLNTCVEVIRKGVQTKFDDDNAYFDSEFVRILTANLETIAVFNSHNDCTWHLKNPFECSLEDLEMGYNRDEFAMMHLDMNMQALIELWNNDIPHFTQCKN